jgi:hypothetical protein
LKTSYGSEAAANAAIPRALETFYRSLADPLTADQRQDLERAGAAIAALYRRHVFPEMNVRFGTYPGNIGHVDAPGCFRCHDDNHKSRDGRTIRQDCELCHSIDS